ncbi:MAG: TonB-dependent receptor domain-containing protein [Alphaproteobacteria bacterium]
MKYLFGGVCAAALTCALSAPPALAQDDKNDDLETMTVTGSFIAGSPEDAALPINVIGRGELDEIGAPTLAELLRNISAAQGLIGETNQFDTRGGQGNEGITTINLRGLGSARTLVLINGRRHAGDEAIGVDVNAIPLIAVERLELLKDGAAALYGSDAIAGVVNFITRNDFEGFELRGNYQWFDGSDGEWDIGGIAGFNGDLWGNPFNVVLAAEYARRSEVTLPEAGFIRPFSENPEGGYSSIGNPGTFLPLNGFAGGLFPDPNCDSLGGTNAAGFCRFQFTQFDNLVEETETIRVFTHGSYDFNENHSMEFEALFARVDIPEWNTSPAYPPQTLLAPSNFVFPDHPGRVRFFEQNPDFAANFNPDEPIIFWGRYTGVAGVNGGQPETSQRLTEQYRGAITFKGNLFDGRLNYDIGAAYSERIRTLGSFGDMFVERFALGLRGLGGPNCDPATGAPGVGPCEYFNPFSNAIETSVVNGVTNPQFDPAVANSEELQDWLVGRGTSVEKNRLAVIDAVFSGDTGIAVPGGTIGFAFGGQIRKEFFELNISDNFNLNQNPCPFNNPVSVDLGIVDTLDCTGSETGLFAFLAGTFPDNLQRNIYGLFAELAIPLTDDINIQLAARYEDYGSVGGGSTLDPKLAVRWQAVDWLAFRGSVSTTFRGPAQSSLTGRGTSLAFIPPTLAFKAVDTVGNPDLQPETAVALNVGALFEKQAGPVSLRATLDYWRFDFSDPFQLESGTQIANAYIANQCADGQAGVGSETCDILRTRIFPVGVNAALLERIDRTLTNGADIVTSGLDFFGQADFAIGAVEVTAGIQGTYTLEFESDDFTLEEGLVVAPGGDFVGFLNEATPFQTIVGLQGNIFTKFNWRNHFLSYVVRYTSSYEDPISARPEFSTIDSFVTQDIYYTLNLFEGRTVLSLSVFNLTDEEPPQVSNDLTYDGFTHSPFGRIVKVGIIQKF